MTLVELLVVVAVIALLALLVAAVAERGVEASRRALCAARMRGLSAGILAAAADRAGEFPRSFHSAFAHREASWGKVILPYLGCRADLPASEWQVVFNRDFRCPSDARTREWSYGLNVYFELDPMSDDYPGSPETWRRTMAVPRPSRTVLLAEMKGSVDHVMAHFWEGSAEGGEVDAGRHGGRSHFAFADGHVEMLPVEATFDPELGIDRWNPGRAGSGTN
jgi:prepilin-type processing-associated H-X9-DG protein